MVTLLITKIQKVSVYKKSYTGFITNLHVLDKSGVTTNQQ